MDYAFIDSLFLSKALGIQHKEIKFILTKFSSDFAEFGNITSQKNKYHSSKGGRPSEVFFLNEPHIYLIFFLCRSSDKSRKFFKNFINNQNKLISLCLHIKKMNP